MPENTFLYPDLPDLKLIMYCIAGVIALLFIVLYWMYRNKGGQHRGYAVAAGWLAFLGIIAVAVTYLGGPFYHKQLILDKVSSDYKVNAVNLNDDASMMIQKNGDFLPCSFNSRAAGKYYVLCEVPEGKVPLDEIKDGRHVKK